MKALYTRNILHVNRNRISLIVRYNGSIVSRMLSRFFREKKHREVSIPGKRIFILPSSFCISICSRVCRWIFICSSVILRQEYTCRYKGSRVHRLTNYSETETELPTGNVIPRRLAFEFPCKPPSNYRGGNLLGFRCCDQS